MLSPLNWKPKLTGRNLTLIIPRKRKTAKVMIWSFDQFAIGELQKRKSYTITQGLPFFDFIRRV